MSVIYNYNTLRLDQPKENETFSGSGCKCKKVCYHFNNVLPKISKKGNDFSRRYCDGEYSSCAHYSILHNIAIR